MLAEMETPTQAEDRLREMLGRWSGLRVRRHRPKEAVLPDPDRVPAIDPTPPEQVPLSEGQPAPGRPGYYDYIPLEPKKAEDRPPLGKG
jgi:hypothetical protein